MMADWFVTFPIMFAFLVEKGDPLRCERFDEIEPINKFTDGVFEPPENRARLVCVRIPVVI